MPYKDRQKRNEYSKLQYRKHRDWYLKYHYSWRRSEKGRASAAKSRETTINMGGKKCRKVRVSFNPRKGICSDCGKTGRTELHHSLGYFMTLPWFGVVELCKKCHGRIGMEERPLMRNVPLS